MSEEFVHVWDEDFQNLLDGDWVDAYEVLADAMREQAAARGLSVPELDKRIIANGIRARKGDPRRDYIPPRQSA